MASFRRRRELKSSMLYPRSRNLSKIAWAMVKLPGPWCQFLAGNCDVALTKELDVSTKGEPSREGDLKQRGSLFLGESDDAHGRGQSLPRMESLEKQFVNKLSR